MKSIYSVEVLQRIIDHWSIGQIEDVTYFENPGGSIWRHFIDTNQGDFELYSYPAENRDDAAQKLAQYLEKRHFGKAEKLQKKGTIHSFDRYHVLLQITKKHRINDKQAISDLNLLVGAKIKKAFRVYGSIFQLHLNESDVTKATVLVSYGK